MEAASSTSGRVTLAAPVAAVAPTVAAAVPVAVLPAAVLVESIALSARAEWEVHKTTV